MQTRVENADFENWGAAAGEAAKVLAAGEVVAVPTETVYGLAAVAFNPKAVAKVFEYMRSIYLTYRMALKLGQVRDTTLKICVWSRMYI